MTEKTATDRTVRTRDRRPAIPAPRTSPENEQVRPAEQYYGYPLLRYAFEHATALRPPDSAPDRDS